LRAAKGTTGAWIRLDDINCSRYSTYTTVLSHRPNHRFLKRKDGFNLMPVSFYLPRLNLRVEPLDATRFERTRACISLDAAVQDRSTEPLDMLLSNLDLDHAGRMEIPARCNRCRACFGSCHCADGRQGRLIQIILYLWPPDAPFSQRYGPFGTGFDSLQ
jgi:hypothetical protein